MPKLSEISVSSSSTPVVRLLRGAATIVGKRRTYRGSIFSVNRSRALSITPEPPRQLAPANSYRIALLSEVSVDDAIVVSALTTAPFCCHADLLTMSAPQLTAVARVLNESLTPSLRINTEPGCPPGQIRGEIETVVGLRSPSHPIPSVETLSQSLSEYTGSHHRLVYGDTLLKDINYDGNIGMTPVTPPLSRTSAADTGSICEPTSRASPSQWNCTALSKVLSASDTDVGTPPSFTMRSRLSNRKDQVLSPRTSTINEAPDTL